MTESTASRGGGCLGGGMQRGVELLRPCWTADPGQQAPGEVGKETLSTPPLIHPPPA